MNQEAIDQIKAERDRLREENIAHAEFLDRKYYILAAENKALRKTLESKRAIFQAGRDSYDTPCVPYTTDDDAWAIFTKEATNG